MQDSLQIYCLLEFADQGQLFKYLQEQGRLPEPRAYSFFQEMWVESKIARENLDEI